MARTTKQSLDEIEGDERAFPARVETPAPAHARAGTPPHVANPAGLTKRQWYKGMAVAGGEPPENAGKIADILLAEDGRDAERRARGGTK